MTALALLAALFAAAVAVAARIQARARRAAWDAEPWGHRYEAGEWVPS